MLVYSSFKNGHPYYLISGKWEFCKMLQLIDCFNLATLFWSTFSDTFVILPISSTLFCQIYGFSTAQKKVTSLSRNANCIVGHAIPFACFACYMIGVVCYAIHVEHHGLITVSIIAKILNRFQEWKVKLYQD